MKRMFILGVMGAVFALFCGSQQTHAAIIFKVVDDFTVDQTLSRSTNGTSTGSVTGALSSIAGGERTATVTKSVPPLPASQAGSSSVQIAGGEFVGSVTGSANNGSFGLSYGENSPLGLDLTSYGKPLSQLYFNTVLESTTSNAFLFTVALYTNANSWSSATLSFPGGGNATITIPMTSFSQGGTSAVTFSNVNKIVFTGDFTGNPGGNASFSTPLIFGAIPEPGSLALWGVLSCLGIGGTVMRRRRAARQRS